MLFDEVTSALDPELVGEVLKTRPSFSDTLVRSPVDISRRALRSLVRGLDSQNVTRRPQPYRIKLV
jgi:hypothetical protein